LSATVPTLERASKRRKKQFRTAETNRPPNHSWRASAQRLGGQRRQVPPLLGTLATRAVGTALWHSYGGIPILENPYARYIRSESAGGAVGVAVRVGGRHRPSLSVGAFSPLSFLGIRRQTRSDRHRRRSTRRGRRDCSHAGQR